MESQGGALDTGRRLEFATPTHSLVGVKSVAAARAFSLSIFAALTNDFWLTVEAFLNEKKCIFIRIG